MNVALVLQPEVRLDPDINNLPGGHVAQEIADGIAGYGIVACVAIFVVGAVMWAMSSRGGNVAYASHGRTVSLYAVAAALLIGGAPAIVNFFIGLGRQI